MKSVTDPPKEHPIVMCSESVIATYAGRKTMTRRVMRLPEYDMPPDGFMLIDAAPDMEPGWYAWRFDSGSGKVPFGPPIKCPHGQPGDLLWVRETWGIHHDYEPVFDAGGRDRHKHARQLGFAGYKAEIGGGCIPILIHHWRSPRFMPKAFARLWLRLVEVRPERLQDIGELDCYSEGRSIGLECDPVSRPGAAWYADYWDRLNAKRGYAWETNPSVWALSYEIDRERTVMA